MSIIKSTLTNLNTIDCVNLLNQHEEKYWKNVITYTERNSITPEEEW